METPMLAPAVAAPFLLEPSEATVPRTPWAPPVPLPWPGPPGRLGEPAWLMFPALLGFPGPGIPFGSPATVAAPLNKVQTGGFGDPNGIPGPGNPNKAGNINQAGSPNLPGGPGHGNGTGGAQGVRGTVASDGSNRNGAATAGASMGVSILYEPNPAYSNEARILKMEGDVVLEVVFLASSQVQVLRVVSGLGHGLDEAALQAAKLIRFKPAQRNGQPVDFPARVRIEFRLSK